MKMIDEDNTNSNLNKTVSHSDVQKKNTADILTRVSGEKFRRRLLIMSRLLALLLIFAICYYSFGIYEYNKLMKEVDAHPCFLCGYHHGMQCQYVYFNWNDLDDIDKENFFLNLGYSNTNQSTIIFSGSPSQNVVNVSILNTSITENA